MAEWRLHLHTNHLAVADTYENHPLQAARNRVSLRVQLFLQLDQHGACFGSRREQQGLNTSWSQSQSFTCSVIHRAKNSAGCPADWPAPVHRTQGFRSSRLRIPLRFLSIISPSISPISLVAFLTNTMANTSKRNFGKMRRSVAPTKQEGVNGKKKSTRTKGMGCRRRGCFRPAARYQRCRHRLILRAHFSQRYLWRSQAPPEEGRI